MELESKHLAPYLPYGLKFQTNNTDIVELSSLSDVSVNIKGRTYIYGAYCDISDVKPILRPMSDFDKIKNDFDLSTDFEQFYLPPSSDLCGINTSDKTYLSDMLTVTEFLFENHFDVFGLIESGLAIDINTLNS